MAGTPRVAATQQAASAAAARILARRRRGQGREGRDGRGRWRSLPSGMAVPPSLDAEAPKGRLRPIEAQSGTAPKTCQELGSPYFGSHFVPKRAAAGSPYRLRRRFLRGTTAAVPVTITRATGTPVGGVTSRRRGGNGAARVGVQDRPGGAGGRGRDLAGPGACGGAGTEGRPRSGRRGPGRRCQPVRLLADVRGGRAAARPGAERPSRAGAGRHQDLDAVG